MNFTVFREIFSPVFTVLSNFIRDFLKYVQGKLLCFRMQTKRFGRYLKINLLPCMQYYHFRLTKD